MADSTKEPASEEKMDPMVRVAERGDVILVLGKQGESSSDILVSSTVLSLASPVFDAMFHGSFAEGLSLTPTEPYTLLLPDDEPTAMVLICKVIHVQTADLPEDIDPSVLANIAVLCDKYQCKEAIRAWSRVWAAVMSQTPRAMCLEKLLFATYVLDLPKEFNRVTLTIILEHQSFINLSQARHNHEFLPMSLFDSMLTDKRELEKRTFEAFHTVTSALDACGESRKALGNLIVSLRSARLWPFGIISLDQLRLRLGNIQDLSATNCHSLYCKGCLVVPQVKQDLIREIMNLYNSVKGQCLDCVKREAIGDRTTTGCRITH